MRRNAGRCRQRGPWRLADAVSGRALQLRIRLAPSRRPGGAAVWCVRLHVFAQCGLQTQLTCHSQATRLLMTTLSRQMRPRSPTVPSLAMLRTHHESVIDAWLPMLQCQPLLPLHQVETADRSPRRTWQQRLRRSRLLAWARPRCRSWPPPPPASSRQGGRLMLARASCALRLRPPHRRLLRSSPPLRRRPPRWMTRRLRLRTRACLQSGTLSKARCQQRCAHDLCSERHLRLMITCAHMLRRLQSKLQPSCRCRRTRLHWSFANSPMRWYRTSAPTKHGACSYCLGCYCREPASLPRFS